MAIAASMVALVADLHPAAAVECLTAQDDHKVYMSWRIIDGKKCWYRGRPGKPKSELYWPVDSTPVAPDSAREQQPSGPTPPQVAVPAISTEPAPEPAPLVWQATPEDQLKAFTCCWPELEHATQQVPDPKPFKVAPLPKATPPATALTPWALAAILVLFVSLSYLIWDFQERSHRRGRQQQQAQRRHAR